MSIVGDSFEVFVRTFHAMCHTVPEYTCQFVSDFVSLCDCLCLCMDIFFFFIFWLNCHLHAIIRLHRSMSGQKSQCSFVHGIGHWSININLLSNIKCEHCFNCLFCVNANCLNPIWYFWLVVIWLERPQKHKTI